ncbi:uncharacterized protein LOC144074047 [Stigmatopora argus]
MGRQGSASQQEVIHESEEKSQHPLWWDVKKHPVWRPQNKAAVFKGRKTAGNGRNIRQDTGYKQKTLDNESLRPLSPPSFDSKPIPNFPVGKWRRTLLHWHLSHVPATAECAKSNTSTENVSQRWQDHKKKKVAILPISRKQCMCAW